MNRLRIVLLSTLLVVGLVPLAGTGTASAAKQLKGSFRGNVYGSFANAKAGDIATTLGRSAYLVVPCNRTDGKTNTNRVTSVDAGDAAKVDTVYNTVMTDKTARTALIHNTSKVSGTRLLDGMIKADVITAVAHTDADVDKIKSTAKDSKFKNLRILGTRLRNSEIKSGERVDLPGFGHVILKDVTRQGNGVKSGSIVVNMVTVVITRDNVLDIPIDSNIVIAHAKSGYNRNEPDVIVGGSAFVTSAKSNATDVENKVGRASAIWLGCEGTHGKTRRNNVNELVVPGVVTSGAGRTTAFGGKVDGGTQAKTTAAVENLNFLDGLVTADLVEGVAKSTYDMGSRSGAGSTEGSSFGNLVIAGVSIPNDVAPNTVVPIAGGEIILREERTSGGANEGTARLIMIHLTITEADNLYGLPAGTDIKIVSANSKALPF